MNVASSLTVAVTLLAVTTAHARPSPSSSRDSSSSSSSLLSAPLTGAVPVGPRAEAARAEAEAFLAIAELRHCDAGAAFLKAHALSAEDRLLFNAALAFERARDRAAALTTLAQITDATLVSDAAARSSLVAAQLKKRGVGEPCASSASSGDAALVTFASTRPPRERYAAAADSGPAPSVNEAAPPPAASPPPAQAGAPAAASSSPSAAQQQQQQQQQSSPLFGWAAGAVVAGAVVGGATGSVWLWHQSVLYDARSSSDAKDAALDGSRSPALIAGGSAAALLVVVGAALVPFALLEEDR